MPAQLVVPHGVLAEDDVEMLEAELGRVRGANVEVRAAQRGEKRRLAELAHRNATHALTYDSIRERTQLERRAMALEELRECLNLESLPLRIECFDISNIQEESPVGSMVVFQDAIAKKAHADGTTLKDAALKLGHVSAAEFDRLVRPEAMLGKR